MARPRKDGLALSSDYLAAMEMGYDESSARRYCHRKNAARIKRERWVRAYMAKSGATYAAAHAEFLRTHRMGPVLRVRTEAARTVAFANVVVHEMVTCAHEWVDMGGNVESCLYCYQSRVTSWNATHDDRVDALTFALRSFRRGLPPCR